MSEEILELSIPHVGSSIFEAEGPSDSDHNGGQQRQSQNLRPVRFERPCRETCRFKNLE